MQAEQEYRDEGCSGQAPPSEPACDKGASECAEDKVLVVGVRFRKAGKIYFFKPGQLQLEKGDEVIVETVRGIEYGRVVIEPRWVPVEETVAPLREVIRKATPEDRIKVEENRRDAKEAFAICQQKIAEHGLPMKLIDAEYTFDRGKILFYFTAEGRVDFRELVKDLASIFKTRIELRQIGVRDEAKLLGGIGPCGRELCCCTFLCEFEPVSIKMAKWQNLSLNPTKISGICGRLMCCLKFEEDIYRPCLGEESAPPPEEGEDVSYLCDEEFGERGLEDGEEDV
ncbi:MAG: PSP1 domain-containing protein [Thermacetogeniaceae bacterium]